MSSKQFWFLLILGQIPAENYTARKIKFNSQKMLLFILFFYSVGHSWGLVEVKVGDQSAKLYIKILMNLTYRTWIVADSGK